MNIKTKLIKATTIMLIVTLGTGISVNSAYLNYNEDKTVIYIESSANIPSHITDYARDVFAHLYVDEITELGFSADETNELRLAPGFCAYSFGDMSVSEDIFYYPVMNDDEIAALLTVTYHDGDYGFAFGKEKLGDSLNQLNTSSDNAVRIVVSDNAFYGVTNDKISVLSSLTSSSQDYINEEQNSLTQVNNDVSRMIINDEQSVITISKDVVYADTFQATPLTRTLYGKLREVPFVDNWAYTDSNNKKHGTCWASCAASLIEYYNNGSSSLESRASSIRHCILAARHSVTGSYSGGTTCIKEYIGEYVSGVNMVYSSSMLTFDEVKTEIFSNRPFYSSWFCGSSGHGMIVCGYSYENTDPDNGTYHRIKLMDPNHDTYRIVSYSDTYTIGGNEYTWTSTLKKG